MGSTRRVENKSVVRIFGSYLPIGPVIGPLVVTGVLFENDAELLELGVRDSKKISPNRRKVVAQRIKEIAVGYKVLVIEASDIDDLRRVMSLNEIEVNAFSKVIESLKPDVCFVDSADVNDERFGNDVLSRLSFKPVMTSKHKADEIFPIVGAASILAKTTRDAYVREIAKELEGKLGLPLGSGYPADPLTRDFLKAWFENFGDLPPYVRRSWKTAQKIIKGGKTRRLDEF